MSKLLAGLFIALTSIALWLSQDVKETRTTADRQEPRFFDGFGNYHRSITTDNAVAQRWFDQGIQLLYGFNHDEAIRSFQQAAKVDPECAMAWWGVAYANGFHINNTEMSEQQNQSAWEAAQTALKLVNGASPAEQALIRAVAERYQWPAPEDRAGLDQAYADAMQIAYQQHSDDPDIAALYAESLMDLQPWDLWTQDRQPKGRTEEIVQVLEATLAHIPDHPGANHFYIHAIEASPWPEKGIAAADRLNTLVPGSGHLVHMPSHIYIRTGRYADAARANEAAIVADREYFAIAPKADFYNLYYLHNMHFLAYAAMMDGRFQTALQAARDVEATIPADFLEKHAKLADGFSPVTLHVLIRFGRWEDILDQPEPEQFRMISRAVRRYARGIALTNLQRHDEAKLESNAFEELAAQIDDEWKVGNNPAPTVLAIARGMLQGEMAFHQSNREQAFQLLREAVATEDQLVYDEPPGWMQPVRHALGALLVADGQFDQAADIYREDLGRHPNNGWGLLGLHQALQRGGKAAEAKQLEPAVTAAWARADVTPHASCYCQPQASKTPGN